MQRTETLLQPNKVFCYDLDFVSRYFFLSNVCLQVVDYGSQYVWQGQCVSALCQSECEKLTPRAAHESRLYFRAATEKKATSNWKKKSHFHSISRKLPSFWSITISNKTEKQKTMQTKENKLTVKLETREFLWPNVPTKRVLSRRFHKCNVQIDKLALDSGLSVQMKFVFLISIDRSIPRPAPRTRWYPKTLNFCNSTISVFFLNLH